MRHWGNARQFCHYQISPWFSKTCLFSISPRAANGGNESRGQFTFLWQQHPAWLRLQFSAIYILPFNIVSIQSSEICTDECCWPEQWLSDQTLVFNILHKAAGLLNIWIRGFTRADKRCCCSQSFEDWTSQRSLEREKALILFTDLE